LYTVREWLHCKHVAGKLAAYQVHGRNAVLTDSKQLNTWLDWPPLL